MSQQVVLKVNTDVLYDNVTQLNESIQDIRKRYSEIASLMTNMSKYWLGDASANHSAEVTKLIEDIEPLIEMLEQKPVQLFNMAGIYSAAEEANKGLTGVLDSNVIN